MRLAFAMAALLCLGASDAAPGIPAHVGGRVVTSSDGSIQFGWPGTYFEGRFEGTALRLRFEAPREYMRLLVDGEERLLFEEPGDVDITVGGMASSQHLVRLEKMTESQAGGGSFKGFFTLANGKPLPPQPKARRIEFIGDSYTVGYGNRSTKRECSREEVHDLTDTQQAFGPLLARQVDADYRVVAYSGFGIVRNYGGSSPGSSLPAIYARGRPDMKATASTGDGRWQPQVVVVNLGTNDFSTELKPGERWKTQQELRSEYREQYSEFLSRLHRSYPRAAFVLMGSNQFIADVRTVADAGRRAGLKVAAVRFGELDLQGCDWHPSLADHRKMAELLARELQSVKPW